jgi:hypothetical protein
VTHTVDKRTITGKGYASDHAVRIETDQDENGQESITLVRLDLNQIDILSASSRTSVEMPYAGNAGAVSAEFASYLSGAEMQRESLGAVKLDSIVVRNLASKSPTKDACT